MPEYEIVRWDEQNSPINGSKYSQQAYEQGKFAFVSDYVRFWAIYKYGGIYFDVDVELICPIHHIVNAGSFMGIEQSFATNGIQPKAPIGVNPGLGMGAYPEHPILHEILDKYQNLDFSVNGDTVVTFTTDTLRAHGLKNENKLQTVEDINIYPTQYFCPIDSTTGLKSITENTVSIHHYDCSWMDHNTINFRLHQFKNFFIRMLGKRYGNKFCKWAYSK